MRRRGRGARRHRRDQDAAAHRTARRLAMLATSPRDGGGVRLVVGLVKPVGHEVRIGVVCAALHAGIRLAGSGQPQRGQIVGVMQVVQFGCPQDLHLAVEGGVVAEVQIVEAAELVERDDVGDLVGVEVWPAVSGSTRGSGCRRPGKTMLGQPGKSSGRNQSVIWTLRR